MKLIGLAERKLIMPKEKTTTRKSKAKHAGEGGKKKKGACNVFPVIIAVTDDIKNRPQCAEAWSLGLHVLRQRTTRQCKRGKSRHHLW